MKEQISFGLLEELVMLKVEVYKIEKEIVLIWLGFSHLSDLWNYNTITNEWTWVSGPKVSNQPAVY